MSAIDTVNRVYREFKRYTGDGLPNEPIGAPLPIGDPQSGVHNPKKSEIRTANTELLVEAEAQANRSEDAAAAAEASAGSLLFRVFPTVSVAQAATIGASASYIAIAEFAPQPRFYKRFASDPGSGDRFQSADGAWWQGLPLPSVTLDFANPVLRAGSASLGGSDMDLVHIFTVPTGTTYTCTLPNPASHVGKLLHIAVDDASLGLLAMAYTTNPIGKFAAGGLKLWAGESLTLIGRSDQWEIIGGRCIPCTLYATNPGANIVITNSQTIFDAGWQTALGGSLYAGAAHALNVSGQITIPRQGFYHLDFDAGVACLTTPTSLYAQADNNGLLNVNRAFMQLPSNTFGAIHASHASAFSAGTAINPVVTSTGGANVQVDRVSISPPQFKLTELPQW